MEVPFGSESEVLHHTHGVNLHKDRFNDPVPIGRLRELPVGIANLLTLPQDIHPGFPVPPCIGTGRMALLEIFALLKITNPVGKKEDETQGSEGSKDPI